MYLQLCTDITLCIEICALATHQYRSTWYPHTCLWWRLIRCSPDLVMAGVRVCVVWLCEGCVSCRREWRGPCFAPEKWQMYMGIKDCSYALFHTVENPAFMVYRIWYTCTYELVPATYSHWLKVNSNSTTWSAPLHVRLFFLHSMPTLAYKLLTTNERRTDVVPPLE